MTRFVVDASVAIKWVVTETGTQEALALLRGAVLVVPDLLPSECANVLWKKVRRGELTSDEAIMSARILQRADIEVYPTRQLLDEATALAIELDHPAYDCVYLSLARSLDCPFVSTDERFLRKLRQAGEGPPSDIALSLRDAAARLDG